MRGQSHIFPSFAGMLANTLAYLNKVGGLNKCVRRSMVHFISCRAKNT